MSDIQLRPEDRVLLVINDNTIFGSTRFQKYGFLLFKQCEKELDKLKDNFVGLKLYDDWAPHHYGPYSKHLDEDIVKAIQSRLLCVSNPSKGITSVDTYSLTIRGHARWRELFNHASQEMKKINEKIKVLQKKNLYVLLKYVYTAYPDYATNNKIKDILI